MQLTKVEASQLRDKIWEMHDHCKNEYDKLSNLKEVSFAMSISSDLEKSRLLGKCLAYIDIIKMLDEIIDGVRRD